ncbi:Phosphatidate cytidylyltransferase [Candidatus Sulfotelmatomonas gaucii]|uniref:Phosphatidate cytidylyltransferase n=1 Tax=Candidatus Sulfuritelmatomonas gaucii TaxID=2043161 RepID=A0A2N9LD21_9BACT|nr:Phosphatidate cytidylyltransferase [Candidatus Sulfotelmatomonas gaucii]
MKRVLTAVVLIPVVLVLVFLGPRWQWMFSLAVAVVSLLAGWEYMSLTQRCGANPPRVATLVALAALFVVNFQWPDLIPGLFGILGLGLLVYCTFFKPVEAVIASAAAAIFCLLYTGLALLALPTLRAQENGPSLLLLLLFAVWAGDTSAYYFGRAWGRHKMAPKLSPGKSWEGAVASVVGSVLMAWALVGLANLLQAPWNSGVFAWMERVCPSAVISYPNELWYWLLLAVIINLAGQVGDLAESALKRSAGMKDSGSLLPGHGGVLDRIDALLLAAPVLWYAQVIHQRF